MMFKRKSKPKSPPFREELVAAALLGLQRSATLWKQGEWHHKEMESRLAEGDVALAAANATMAKHFQGEAELASRPYGRMVGLLDCGKTAQEWNASIDEAYRRKLAESKAKAGGDKP